MGQPGTELFYIDELPSQSSDRGNSADIVPTFLLPTNIPRTAWQVFTNPRTTLQSLWVQKQPLEMRVFESTEAPSQSWAKIPPITVSEHQQIARNFLPDVPLLWRQDLAATIERADYWKHWTSRIRDCGSSVSYPWTLFRNRCIGELFLKRLEQLQITELSARQTLLDQLKDSRHPGISSNSARFQKDSKESESNKSTATEPTDEESFREIIIEAIKRMSLDEMRRICVPAGILSDVISKHKRHSQ